MRGAGNRSATAEPYRRPSPPQSRAAPARYDAAMGTPEFDDRFVRFYLRHVVALNVECDMPNGTRGRDVYSCFVLEMWGEWFLVTSGHALKDLLSILPERKNVSCSLFDAWRPAASRFPIPFSLLDARSLAVFVDGLDLGLVHLDELFRRGLQSNGIVPFIESTWRKPPAGMRLHAVVGFPEQFIDRRPDTAAVLPTFVYMDAVEPPPEMAKLFPRFYGKLPPHFVNPHTGATLTDMDGFSGAPIIGFHVKEDGQVSYFLVAIQSGWRSDLRIVAGPLLPAIADWLGKQVEQA